MEVEKEIRLNPSVSRTPQTLYRGQSGVHHGILLNRSRGRDEMYKLPREKCFDLES